jgi:hypothetical protein
MISCFSCVRGSINVLKLLHSFLRFSIDKIPKVTSPVLVIHGTEDEVIDFSHGLAIYEKCPRPVEPLWVEVIFATVFISRNISYSFWYLKI